MSGEVSARGVVHDLANYLLALELNLREEARSNPSERVATSIACLENAVGLLRNSYVRLKTEFQLPAGNFFDPIDVFKQVTKLHAYQLQLARLKVLYSGRPAALQGNRFAFQRVLTNLLLNSIEAHRRNHSGKRGTIYVIAREKDGAIQLSIEDEAGGIVRQNRIEDRDLTHLDPESGELQQADTLMDSGFTTKAYGNHGDGLKVVKEIISQEFSGSVSFVTAEKGVKVILNLPK